MSSPTHTLHRGTPHRGVGVANRFSGLPAMTLAGDGSPCRCTGNCAYALVRAVRTKGTPLQSAAFALIDYVIFFLRRRAALTRLSSILEPISLPSSPMLPLSSLPSSTLPSPCAGMLSFCPPALSRAAGELHRVDCHGAAVVSCSRLLDTASHHQIGFNA